MSPDSRSALARRAGAVAVALAALVLAGCRQDMHDQPSYKPLAASDFFADGSSARPLPAGTVARGFLREDALLYTGRTAEGSLTSELPMPVTRAAARARPRALRHLLRALPRHSWATGEGMIVQRGFKQPLELPRRAAAPGAHRLSASTS